MSSKEFKLLIHNKYATKEILSLLSEGRVVPSYLYDTNYWKCSDYYVTPKFLSQVRYDVWPSLNDDIYREYYKNV